MRKIVGFIYKNKHLKYIFIFLPLFLVFYLCESLVQPKYIVYSDLDEYIPFVPYFIVAYLFWFIYMALGFFYFGLKSKEDFIALLKFIFLGMGISYISFILFPNYQELRPNIYESDVFSSLISFIYSIDTPTNVCPSIHVINSIGVNSAIWKSDLFKDKKIIKCLSVFSMALICASTLFIKQHSIIDVLIGMALASVLHLVIYTIPRARSYEVEKVAT